MNDVIMISVPMERYEELLRAEAKLQFLAEYAVHETMLHEDLIYYLGINKEEKSDDKD